jgi:hypothetical protein
MRVLKSSAGGVLPAPFDATAPEVDTASLAIDSAAVWPPGTPVPEELRGCLAQHLATLESELRP